MSRSASPSCPRYTCEIAAELPLKRTELVRIPRGAEGFLLHYGARI